MKRLGTHFIVEFTNCSYRALTNKIKMEYLFVNALKEMGAHIIHVYFHQFSPHGISGVIIISESHITIHSWPEYNYVAVDLFSCSDTLNPRKGFVYLQDKLKAKNVFIRKIARGIPSSNN